MKTLDSKPSKPLRHQIADDLKQKIQDGDLKIGDKLPPEIEIADQFGGSRGTVRLAMQELVQQGLLYRVRGKGTFIADVTNVNQANGNESRLIGIIVPYLRESLVTDMVEGSEQIIRKSDYSLVVGYTHDDFEIEIEQIERFKELKISGLILFPLVSPEEREVIDGLLRLDIPLVLIDRHLPEVALNTVMADNYSGAYEAVAYLQSLGHQRIGCVSQQPSALVSSAVERIRGYEQAMRDADLLPLATIMAGIGSRTSGNVLPTTSSEEMKFVDHMLKISDRPTAVFCINDFVALSVLRHALSLGIRVPEDLAIVGFDDIPFAQLASVPLTTVAQPKLEIGMKAAELLLAQIDGTPLQKQTYRLPTQLVVRAST